MKARDWTYAKSKYYTYQDAIREQMIELAADPVIAAALAQIDMAYLAIDGRMAQLADEEEDNQ